MRKAKIIVVVLLFLVLGIAVAFFLIGYFRPQGAGILIETDPPATVYIDDVQVGRTPYEEIRAPGETIVKLVPESFEKPLALYETKVTLVSGVETVVRRVFGESDEDSSGEIVSFEKIGRNESSLSIVSIPDSAQITIDNETKAFAPYKTSSLAPGEHLLTISALGYQEKSINLKTHEGYKLTIVVQLSPSEEQPQVEGIQEEVAEEEEVEERVVILSTPIGFLRVRAEPSTLGEEIGRVEPDDSYILTKVDEDTGWFKIVYEPATDDKEAKEGWISNQYAEKVEELTSETTPTATPLPEE